MFTVIYSFKVKPDKVQSFEKAWSDLTSLILEYEESLGSRLHKQSEFNYIAYAQWPSKIIWQNSGNKLPDTANDIIKLMKEACEKIETLYELEVINDLLKK